MTSFEEKIYQAVRKIPRGKVKTYKEIARIIGHPHAYRAVGSALNKNPYAPEVPCHRVIKSDGLVGGYASGTKKKIALLRREGVEIKNGKEYFSSCDDESIKIKKPRPKTRLGS